MTKTKVGAALAAVCALLLIVPVTGGAQSTRAASTTPKTVNVKSFQAIPITGQTASGKSFSGKLNVTRFVHRKGKTWAVGTLSGKLDGQSVSRSNVAFPVSLDKTARSSATTRQATSCSVLHLVVGPINLNLLGLQVTTNQITLDITAIPGAGNLLGNLLCDVTNLLNGSSVGSQLANILNVLQAILAGIHL